MSGDARELLRSLVPIDRRVAVWCAAQCARTALQYVPEGELRPLRAIEAAEAWAREPSEEGKGAAYGIAVESHCAALGATKWAASAARAAYYAALAAHADRASYAANAAAKAADEANAAAHAIRAPNPELHALCRAERWPLSRAPSIDARLTLPVWQQVAWDEIDSADLHGEITVAQLFEAYLFRVPLQWEGADRALAERLALRPDLRALVLVAS